MVYNYKENLGEYFCLLSLITNELLCRYKILKSFIISIDFNLRVCAFKLYILLK